MYTRGKYPYFLDNSLGYLNYNLFLCRELQGNTTMRTTSEYLNLLKQFKLNRAAAYGIKSLGLFGSAARGELHEGSEVDVVYEGEPNILLRSRMKAELEALFGCRVDVVRYRKQLNGTPFGDSINQDLILV